MQRKFVYSTSGKAYIIRQGGYHHDCGLRSDNVAYAGWFNYDPEPEHPETEINLFGSSEGYGIDIGPEVNHPKIKAAILEAIKG